jgi:hypothetical protein
MRLRLGLAIGLISIASAPAEAAERYASPPGSGSACAKETRCSLRIAVEDANTGDEVILGPGSYPVPVQFFPPASVSNLYIHGELDQPMPRIVATNASAPPFLVQGDGSRWSHLEFTTEESGLIVMSCHDGEVFERARVFASGTGTDGLALTGSCLVRNSLIRVAGDDAAALSAESSTPGAIGHVRNVTAIATGGGKAVGVSSAYVGNNPGAYTLDLRNTIAIGNGFDLQATQEADGPGHIVVDHSNFRSAEQEGLGTVSGQPNLTLPPLFLNPATDDYRLGTGWPTIDAGAVDPLIGELDLAGNPRILGSAPDIGAFELVPAAAPTAGRIDSLSIRPKVFRPANAGGAILSASSKGKKTKKAPLTAKVVYSLSAPSKVAFTVARRSIGRRSGGACVRPTRANRSKKACPLLRRLKGGFAEAGAAGANTFKFSGRLGARALAPGAYRLTGSAGSDSRSVAFRIVR